MSDNQEQSEYIKSEFSNDEIICATVLWSSTKLINDVLKRCGLSMKNDPEQWHFVRKMLMEQTDKRIIYAIWTAITPEHKEHFNSFKVSALKTDSAIDHETILVKFALIYPDIQDKVFAAMEEFFDEFVENYKNIFG